MRLSELCIRRPVMTTLRDGLAAARRLLRLPPAADRRHPAHRGADHHGHARSIRAPAPTPWRCRSRRRSSGSSPPSPASPRSPRSTPRATPRSRWSSTSTATSTPPPSTCSRRSRWPPRGCPRTCRRRRPTARSIPADAPIIFLALTSDTAPSQEMNEFADKVMSPRLSTITGVAQINIQGAQKRAVRIKYDLDALATRGISVEEIRQAVATAAGIEPRRQHPHAAAALHPRGQGRRADRRLLQAADRGLAQRRAGAAAGHRQGRGLGRERRGARRVQRHALHHRLGPAPARRQHGGRHRCHPSAHPGVPAAAAADHQAQRLERPVGVDPRLRARRAAHADPDGRAGDPGHPGLPAHLARHLHSRRWPCRCRSSAPSPAWRCSASRSTT